MTRICLLLLIVLKDHFGHKKFPVSPVIILDTKPLRHTSAGFSVNVAH